MNEIMINSNDENNILAAALDRNTVVLEKLLNKLDIVDTKVDVLTVNAKTTEERINRIEMAEEKRRAEAPMPGSLYRKMYDALQKKVWSFTQHVEPNERKRYYKAIYRDLRGDNGLYVPARDTPEANYENVMAKIEKWIPSI